MGVFLTKIIIRTTLMELKAFQRYLFYAEKLAEHNWDIDYKYDHKKYTKLVADFCQKMNIALQNISKNKWKCPYCGRKIQAKYRTRCLMCKRDLDAKTD